MDEQDFEGTLILEKLAVIGKVDAFFAAIDNDDFTQAASLMRQAKVDAETIALALKEMSELEDE